MIYCVSNIHGRIDLFSRLLEEVRFSDDDFIYILGDCIDKGGGLAALERIMDMQANSKAKLILGNHEHNFLKNISSIDFSIVNKIEYADFISRSNITRNNYFEQNSHMERIHYLYQKFFNSVTAANELTVYESYHSCMDFWSYDIERQNKIKEFLTATPTYEDIRTDNGKCFRLLHAGCDKDGKVDLSISNEFFTKESPIKDKTIVFGHSNTKLIRMLMDGVYTKPTIWYDKQNGNDKIGIDCDCAHFGGRLACLRLDDMQEFYIENDNLMTYPISSFNEFINDNGYSISDFKYNIWNL